MKYSIASTESMNVMGLVLFGASTKRSDNNSIGQFGTGLKYSIATLLRNKIDFQIYIDGKEIKIITKTVSLGDQEFEQIWIDGQQTSLTTELGMHWETRHCLREVITNAMDAKERIVTVDASPGVISKGTQFVFDINDEIQKFIDDYDMLFIEDRLPVFECSMGQIYEKIKASPGDGIYTKHVLCVDMPNRTTVFDYNHHNIKLSELRLAESNYEALSSIRALIGACTNKDVMRRILIAAADKESLESEMLNDLKYGYDNVTGLKSFCKDNLVVPIDEVDRLTEKERENAIFVSEEAYSGLKHKCTGMQLPLCMTKEKDELTVITNYDDTVLIRCLQMLGESGIHLTKYDFAIARFANADVQGCFHKGKIYLSVEVLHIEHELLGTIVEEYIHRTHMVSDFTREFQNKAMDLIARIIKHHA